MSDVKAVYYSDNDKVYEINAYAGFDTSKMILIGNSLQEEEEIYIDLIELVEDDDSNVIQSFKKNFLEEWYMDMVNHIERNYEGVSLQYIDGYDSCILGVVLVDDKECILYDSKLIKSQMLRGDKEHHDMIEFAFSEMQRNYSDCAFTDFPIEWSKTP